MNFRMVTPQNKTSVLIFGILIVALIGRLLLVGIHLREPNFSFQQDNYVDYAVALKKGILGTWQFPQDDTRLFPGYPIFIFLLVPILKSEITAGLAISLAASILAIYLFWLLTKNSIATAIFAFFPPVWVMQGTKVATEPITAFLLLAAIILYQQRLFLLAGLVLGLAADIRLISLCLLAALLIQAYLKNKREAILPLLSGFIPAFSLLFLFNYFIFGAAGIFQQFIIYPPAGRAAFGGIQIIQDVFRTLDWGQYRILLSGLFYLFMNLLALFQLYKYRKTSPLFQIFFYWMFFSLLFIFTFGPTPLLEEFRRFAVPFTPALILGLLSFKMKKEDEN